MTVEQFKLWITCYGREWDDEGGLLSLFVSSAREWKTCTQELSTGGQLGGRCFVSLRTTWTLTFAARQMGGCLQPYDEQGRETSFMVMIRDWVYACDL